MKLSSSSESLLASHYDVIFLTSPRHHAVSNNSSEPPHTDLQQCKVGNVTCTEDDASEDYVPIDLKY